MAKDADLRHINEFRIFYDIQSITSLLYTLKIVILGLIMFLLGYPRPCGLSVCHS